MGVRELFSTCENFKYLQQKGYGDLFIDFIGGDVGSGEIRGELISVRCDDSGNTSFAFYDEKRRRKEIQLDDYRLYLSLIIQELELNELQLSKGIIEFFEIIPLLRKYEATLILIDESIRSDEDIRKYFTVSSLINWKGTMKELAQKAVEDENNKLFRSLASACRHYAKTHTIEGEPINLESFASMARQIKSGNRL